MAQVGGQGPGQGRGPGQRRGDGGPGQAPVRVSQIRVRLSAITSATTTTATTVVTGWFATDPMTARERVSSTSGTSTNGNPKDSTTCEMTRASVGSTPSARMITAGTMVITRRTSS